MKSQPLVFTSKQVNRICDAERVRFLYMTLLIRVNDVTAEDLGDCRRALTFAADWKAGKMFSFDETAKWCNKVEELHARYKHLLPA